MISPEYSRRAASALTAFETSYPGLLRGGGLFTSNVDSIKENIVSQVKSNSLLSVPTSDSVRFCWFGPENNRRVAVVFPSSLGGTYKNVFFGVISSLNGTSCEEVALLETNRKEKFVADSLEREIKLLTRAVDTPIPGSVPVIGINIQEENGKPVGFIAVFPRFPFDLDLVLRAQKKPFSLSTNVRWSKLLLEEVASFHKEFLHLDLKPENILVNISLPSITKTNRLLDPSVLEDPNATICFRLTDLGFVIPRSDAKPRAFVVGSPLFLSPEAAEFFLRTKTPQSAFTPSEQQDVWSCGLVLLMLVDPKLFAAVSTPTSLPDNLAIAMSKIYKQYFELKNIPNFPEPQDKDCLLHIIWEMLCPDPLGRLPLDEALVKIEQMDFLFNCFQFEEPVSSALGRETDVKDLKYQTKNKVDKQYR